MKNSQPNNGKNGMRERRQRKDKAQTSMQWAKAGPKAKERGSMDTRAEKAIREEKETKREREKAIVSIVAPPTTKSLNAPIRPSSNSKDVATAAANGDIDGQSAAIGRAPETTRNPHLYRKYRHHRRQQRKSANWWRRNWEEYS